MQSSVSSFQRFSRTCAPFHEQFGQQLVRLICPCTKRFMNVSSRTIEVGILSVTGCRRVTKETRDSK